MDSMIDILSSLPLFAGVSHQRMSDTVGMAKFHFLKYLPGQPIVRAGEACSHIRFIISGKVRIEIVNADERFRIGQTLAAPAAISPDFLFGTSTRYPCNVTAIDTVSIVQISKADYIRIINSDEIFLFNYLNYLSMNAQKCIEGILSLSTGSVEERIALWVITTTQPGSFDVTLSCRQRDMYSVFGVQRSSFIAALDRLKAKGIIDYVPGEIRVLDRRAILSVMRDGLE